MIILRRVVKPDQQQDQSTHLNINVWKLKYNISYYYAGIF